MTQDLDSACIANATTEPDEHEEIEITEMIAAGCRELELWSTREDSWEDIVVCVFEAMLRAKAKCDPDMKRPH
jgi:hypothetical protein